MGWFKRLLALSAAALAVVAFITMLAPLSSHIYTVEEVNPYLKVKSWMETSTYISTSYSQITNFIATGTTINDSPNDGSPWHNILKVVYERKDEDTLHIYLFMSGDIKSRTMEDWIYGVHIDYDGDKKAEYSIWYWGTCKLCSRDGQDEELPYEIQDNVLHIMVPLRKINYHTAFYTWAEAGLFHLRRLPDLFGGQFYFDITKLDDAGIIENPDGSSSASWIDLKTRYATVTKTIYKSYIYTLTLSSTYTTSSTETHTLTEKVPLSYWHGWLPYILFASAAVPAVALLISSTLAPSLALRKKRGEAKLAVAVPEGRIVKLCHSCGMENPLDAEYCMECGARLQP